MRKLLPFFTLAAISLFSLYSFVAGANSQPNPPGSPNAWRPSGYFSGGSIDARVNQYRGQTCERSYDEFKCMVCNCMREAAGEPYEGKKLVGLVVKSRVEDSRWPNDICGVIYQYKQFSWTNDGGARHPLPRTSTQGLRECVAATQETISAPGNGMDHYHADYVSPKWAKRCQRVAKVGRHIFYDRCASEGRRGRGTNPATRTSPGSTLKNQRVRTNR